MADVTLRHDIFCTENDYWEKCVWGAPFNEGLYLKSLGFPRYEVQSDIDGTDVRTRRTLIEPPVAGLPAPLKKVMGDTLSYVENATFNKATRVYAFKVTPSVFADKAKIHGTLSCEAAAGNKFVRVAKIFVEVKVFGIGGMVEERIMADLRRSYDVGATFTNDFAAQGGFSTK